MLRDFTIIFDDGSRYSVNGAHVADALERHGVKRIDIKAVMDSKLFYAMLDLQNAGQKLNKIVELIA
jgi:molecular chaperone GrpE (heat shock protein)